MPCDAACVKIIINSRFMAALAPQIVQRTPQMVKGPLPQATAALGLTAAARVLCKMADARGFTVALPDDFSGCEQASLLVEWLRSDHVPATATERMEAWTAELWQHIADLAAGKPLTPPSRSKA